LRKSQLLKTDFDGSDNEPYEESEDNNEGSLRDDFSLSDDETEAEEEKRDRAFFGDDEYTLLSQAPALSMTMQEKEKSEKQARVFQLKRDLDLLQIKITSRVAEGEHLAGQSMDF
jgi:hypothetical protein